MLCLCSCAQALSSCIEQGYAVAVLWLLIVVASLVGEPTGSWASIVAARDLGSCGFQALELGLSLCGA